MVENNFRRVVMYPMSLLLYLLHAIYLLSWIFVQKTISPTNLTSFSFLPQFYIFTLLYNNSKPILFFHLFLFSLILFLYSFVLHDQSMQIFVFAMLSNLNSSHLFKYFHSTFYVSFSIIVQRAELSSTTLQPWL